ncbi:hypothetical protein [Deinococcus radiopugnans]|nr:hypothetical protein [Deinococcus radiopugnans]
MNIDNQSSIFRTTTTPTPVEVDERVVVDAVQGRSNAWPFWM